MENVAQKWNNGQNEDLWLVWHIIHFHVQHSAYPTRAPGREREREREREHQCTARAGLTFSNA